MSLDMEQPSGVSMEYSSEKLLNGNCSTVLLKPVSTVFNPEALVHTAINSTYISVSADERIKEDSMSNVVVTMFSNCPNIVLWTFVWCFGRHADTLRRAKWIKSKMPLCCSH